MSSSIADLKAVRKSKRLKEVTTSSSQWRSSLARDAKRAKRENGRSIAKGIIAHQKSVIPEIHDKKMRRANSAKRAKQTGMSVKDRNAAAKSMLHFRKMKQLQSQLREGGIRPPDMAKRDKTAQMLRNARKGARAQQGQLVRGKRGGWYMIKNGKKYPVSKAQRMKMSGGKSGKGGKR